MSEWVLQGRILVIRNGDEVIVPSADDIYTSLIEDRSPGPGVPQGRGGDAQDLKFIRYPAEVQVVIEDSSGDGMPSAVLTVQPRSGNAFRISHDELRTGHVVESGTWYPFRPSDVDSVNNLLREGDAGDQGVISSFRGLLSLKKAAASGEPVTDLTKPDRLSPAFMQQAGGRAPEGINAELYPYQIDGWRWLSFIIREELGALLADEMGLGKTLQVISAIRDPGTGTKITHTLVVAPGSLLENWKREIEKFCPDLSVMKHQGSMRTGRPKELENYDVVVTSYDTVVRDLSLLKMIDWAVVALDEAQNIKNPEAKRTESIKQLKRSSSLAITGTPVENSLTDLWSIMDFVHHGYLGSIKEFRDAYEEDVDAAERIEPLISPLMLRRRVASVATDLPERIDIPEVIDLSDVEAKEYDRIRKTILEECEKSGPLVALTKLRQFCAHPTLLSDHNADNLSDEFVKFSRLVEIVEEIMLSQEKAIIFTSYTKMADMIAFKVRKRFGVFADTLDGRTPIDDRQQLIDRFSAESGPGILVLNPKAGGSGLNITAATHVIHYNLEWNPALEDQASARAHRRGQTRPVMVRRLICRGTVEEIVEARVQRKREISNVAVVGVNDIREETNYADIMTALSQSPMRRGNE